LKQNRFAIHELGQQDRTNQKQTDQTGGRRPGAHPQLRQRLDPELNGIEQEHRDQKRLQHRAQLGDGRSQSQQGQDHQGSFSRRTGMRLSVETQPGLLMQVGGILRGRISHGSKTA
jgi:hypothetical protein